MADVHSVSGASSSQATSGTNAGAGAGATGDAGNFDSNTSISTMEDLRSKAPKVYQAMMQGLAQHIIDDMDKHQKRIAKLNDEYKQIYGI